MQFRFTHNNINVADAERSVGFYKEALGLREARRIEREGFTLVFMEDGVSGWQMEITCLKDHPQAYDLGENEIHTALTVDDFDAALAHHRRMDCVCFENADMGIYFIEDPDGYWVEILPQRR